MMAMYDYMYCLYCLCAARTKTWDWRNLLQGFHYQCSSPTAVEVMFCVQAFIVFLKKEKVFSRDFWKQYCCGQCSQVDPIVASFSGGAVGVISSFMIIEINNVKQQEKMRCRYCNGTGRKVLLSLLFMMIQILLFLLFIEIQNFCFLFMVIQNLCPKHAIIESHIHTHINVRNLG